MPHRPGANAGQRPLYQVIVDDIHSQIERQRLRPGDPVPSIGGMTDIYNVSAITVKRAMEELRRHGLVRSIKGKGSFVTELARQPQRTPRQRRTVGLRSILLLTSNNDVVKTRSFFAEIWAHVQEVARDRNLEFRVQIVPEQGAGLDADLVIQPEAGEGVILMAASYPFRILHLFRERSLPIVMVDAACSFAPCVLTDNYDGMRQLIRHLRDKGHRRFLLASEDPRSPNPTNENERTAAFRFLMEEYGLEGSVERGLADKPEEIVKRLHGAASPSVVMFNQDSPAIDFCQHAAKIGLKVPRDVSVTGFDGWVNYLTPMEDLTTLQVDLRGLGAAAVQCLQAQAEQPARLRQWLRVKGRLLRGQTVGRVNA